MRANNFFWTVDIFNAVGMKPSGRIVDVGGSEMVILDNKDSPNPILQLECDLTFVDAGFLRAPQTTKYVRADFCDPLATSQFQEPFDFVFSFMTLEHVYNPQIFVDNLAKIAKEDGFIIIDTVFSFPYHPIA